jgi:endoglucanase
VQFSFSQTNHTIAHWPINEGKDTILNDISGNGFHGKITNPEWNDTGLLFRMKTLVNLRDDALFRLKGDWTVEYDLIFHNKPQSASQVYYYPQVIFARQEYSRCSYAFYVHSSIENVKNPGKIGMYWQTSVDTKDFSTPYVFPDKSIKIINMKKNNTIYVIVDGRLVTRFEDAFDHIALSGGSLHIGQFPSQYNVFVSSSFQGYIHNLKISDTALYNPINRVNGIIARWNFDENTGDTVKDISGHGHNGVIKGARWDEGITGSSLLFSDSGYVSIPRDEHFNLDSSMTVIMWVRLNRYNNHNYIINRFSQGRGFYFKTSGKIPICQIGDRSYSYDSLLIDRWTQLALVKNGNMKRCFINGRLYSQTSITGGVPGFYDSTLFIGSNSFTKTDSSFNGNIDEISIYDCALPDDSILIKYGQITNAASPDTSPPLLICDKLDVSIQFSVPFSYTGVEAWDGIDGNITKKISIDGTVDHMVPGKYTLVYSATNSRGKTASITRTVTVIADTIPPVLTVTGDRYTSLMINESYKRPTYTAIDNPLRKNLTDSVKFITDFDSSKAGFYTFRYSVQDLAGHVSSVVCTVAVSENPVRKEIWINQIGYYPLCAKRAVVLNAPSDSFDIVNMENSSIVFSGVLSAPSVRDSSCRIADFSSFQKSGTYQLIIRNFGRSYPIHITETVYSEVLKAALKSYYYQRCSIPISSNYGGKYCREAGHPDTACSVFGNNAIKKSVSGGWYDAGDYGKYIVNGGITVATLLSLYEICPSLYGDAVISIPESGNSISDLLDEIRWELDWFKKMQDTITGAVAFKVGPLIWPSFVMPSADTGKRYIIGETSTASTLNFCAVMAQAGRVFSDIDTKYAADCIYRARRAWEWAQGHKAVLYPTEGGGTGLYEDNTFDDEFLWAAVELYISTNDTTFLSGTINSYANRLWSCARWNNVNNLPLHSLALQYNKTGSSRSEDAKKEVIRFGTSLYQKFTNSPTDLTVSGKNYNEWGSNGEAANCAVSLGYTYLLTKDINYRNAVVSILDYICGKNPAGYCFITGFGSKSPNNPHHRISGSDTIKDAIPGYVVGGINSGREDERDGVVYPSSVSYVDDQKSYSSNEIAINWTAPFMLAAAMIENDFRSSIPVSTGSYPKSPGNRKSALRVVNSHSIILISLDVGAQQLVSWKLIDMIGRTIVSSENNNVKAGYHVFKQKIGNVKSGMYFLKVNVGATSYTSRINFVR